MTSMSEFTRAFAILQENTAPNYTLALYRAREAPGAEGNRIYKFVYVENEVECTVGVQNPSSDPVLISVRFRHLQDPTIVVGYWDTGATILCPQESDEPIPVYDFLHRNHLFLQPYNQVCKPFQTNMISRQITTRANAFKWIDRYWPRWVHQPPVIKGTPPSTEPKPATGKIPAFVIEALIQKDLTQECPISFVPLKDCKVVAAADCFHCFEKEAIEEWLKTSRDCPACRKRIRALSEYRRMI